MYSVRGWLKTSLVSLNLDKSSRCGSELLAARWPVELAGFLEKVNRLKSEERFFFCEVFVSDAAAVKLEVLFLLLAAFFVSAFDVIVPEIVACGRRGADGLQEAIELVTS